MPKVVTDKEKIERLKAEVASLKKEKKEMQKELKSDRRKLRAKVRYLSGKQSSNIDISLSEVEKLKIQNQKLSESINRLESQLQSAKSELSTVKGSTENYVSEIGKMSLYYYHTGWQCDNMDRPFFDPQTLIIKINPLNGEMVTLLEQNTILAIIQNDEEYIAALKRFEPYKDTHINPYSNECELLYNEGKALLPKYINHFIGYGI